MLAMAVVVTTTACSTDRITSPGATDPTLSSAEALAGAVGWRLIAAKGSGPANVNASAHAPNLRAIFAAQMFDYQAGTLWRFDLRTDKWTQLSATNWPIGKYRNLIYDAPNRRLLTYWDGLGQVYAIPETGGAWTAEGSASNLDTYYEGYSFLNPVSRRLSVFAGYGFGTWKDLMWEWDGVAGQWLNIPQSTPRPAPRFGHGPATVAVDFAGARAFLGQRSLGAAPGNYDDLWMVDLRTYTWRNLIAPDSGARARLNSALAYAQRTSTLYRFGGCSPITAVAVCTTFTKELRSAKPNSTTVAWSLIKFTGTAPSGRMQSGLFFDAPRNRLILVSGVDAISWQDDVWAYNLP
jgi:hypothetical protein